MSPFSKPKDKKLNIKQKTIISLNPFLINITKRSCKVSIIHDITKINCILKQKNCLKIINYGYNKNIIYLYNMLFSNLNYSKKKIYNDNICIDDRNFNDILIFIEFDLSSIKEKLKTTKIEFLKKNELSNISLIFKQLNLT